MTNAWPPKAPGDVFTYEVDWTDDVGLDPITLVVATASGVTIDYQLYTEVTSTVVLSGGTSGTIATVSFAVTTASGFNNFTRDMSLLIADSVELLTPTSTTKRTLVQMAFEEIGLAGYEFDATTEEYNSALRRMDALAAQWKAGGIDLGYNAPLVLGTSQLTDVAGIPDAAVDCFISYLALRIMPVIGKTQTVESKKALADAMVILRANYAVIPERALPRKTAIGAGGKPWSTWYPFAGQNGSN